MSCSFCGYAFNEQAAHLQCQGCLLSGSCSRIQCPRCGFEMPEELKIFKWLDQWRKKIMKRFQLQSSKLANAELSAPSRNVSWTSEKSSSPPLDGEGFTPGDKSPGDPGSERGWQADQPQNGETPISAPPSTPERRLAEMIPGQQGTVTTLLPRNKKEMQKLLSLGLLPGQTVTLHKRFPSFVFQVGYSQFAVDHQIAHSICVRPGREKA